MSNKDTRSRFRRPPSPFSSRPESPLVVRYGVAIPFPFGRFNATPSGERYVPKSAHVSLLVWAWKKRNIEAIACCAGLSGECREQNEDKIGFTRFIAGAFRICRKESLRPAETN